MTCGHLFNGIGGFALAAHWMGWSNLMHCEIDPFCNKVMNYHFPNSYQHEDIRTTDFTIWRGKLDLITGGFPCQPCSTAGKRKGKNDDRHLWPEMLRAIREIQPGYVVGENVRGLTNWNGGLVFDEVQADLEAEGYEVLPFLLPAAGVGAPHRRDRIWFVAHANSGGFGGHIIAGQDRCETQTIKGASHWQERNEVQREWDGHIIGGTNATGATADTESIGWDDGTSENKRQAGRKKHPSCHTYPLSTWADWPTQSPVCGRDDGLSFHLADISFSKWRKESIKALGNAIVPEVAFQIFKTIEQYNICA